MQTTVISGSDTHKVDGGPFSIKMRLQHYFEAEDITFTQSPGTGAKVTSIYFGAHPAWNDQDGVDVSVFSKDSFMRGLLKGQKIRAGLDITVNGTVGKAEDLVTAIIKGEKPAAPC